MLETPLGPRLQLLLDRYEKAGGVMEFFRFDLEGHSGDSSEAHRIGAIGVLESLVRRSSRFFHVTIDSTALTGRHVTLAEFFGPGFDLTNRRLLYREPRCNASNGLFWEYSPSASPLQRIDQPGDEFAAIGFAEAFAAPPHGLSGQGSDIKRMFRALVDELFGDPPSPSTIWRWSTNCSNYFDAGHEWWGSYLWTLHCQARPYLIGVAVSTTD